MTVATCTGSKIACFEFMEDYDTTAITDQHITVITRDGIAWHVPVYEGDTYEVTDSNGNNAIFIV